MTRGVWVGALLALGVAGEAAARAPEQPLSVGDTEQPWTVVARIEARKFAAVTVRRTVWRRAEPLGTRVLETFVLDPNSPLLFNMFSLQPEDLADLPDGYYHLAVVAEGELRKPDAPRYEDQHLVYVKVEEGVPTRLTQAQYSALTDPEETVEGPGGVPVRVQRGGAVKAPRPAPRPGFLDRAESLNTQGVPGSESERNER